MKLAPFLVPTVLSLALALAGCAARAPAPAAPIDINLVALNDFHGHLEATKFVYTSAREGKENTMMAGGIDNLAAALQAYRVEDKDLLLVGAGDLVGGTPALSSMWGDEPSIVALSMLGMKFSSVGNHEFDQGRAELLRKQRGGCKPTLSVNACKFAPDFSGAAFSYLAANVIDKVTGQPLLPAFAIEQVKGVKVAFIGAVLKNTPSVVLASGIAGLAFTDEADAINKALPQARAQGATAFVVLIHEGGHTTEPFDQPDCTSLKGPVVGIAERLDPAIRLVISGHSHTGFQCKAGGRTITQAQMGGHVLSRIKLSIDPATGSVLDVAVRNVPVKPGEYPADPKVAGYLARVKAQSAAALARPIARVAQRSTARKMNEAGESALGGLVADAVVEATRAQGVQVGFMNMGGLRSDFDVADNLTATFGQAQAVLPFSNTLVVMDMTGAQLRALLENQWLRASGGRSMLQVSRSFYYKWDNARPDGQRVVPGSIRIDGAPLDDAKTYRVVANNFLAEGGDGYPVFKQAANKVDTQILDLDAFVGYLARNQPGSAALAAPAAPRPRIDRIN
ncbi:bifunctional metallophosphatase/5'-nucleotidase [Massilia eurypsychrophila]|uniref:Bifunctional metallophosphatase/5'-nucleotidase n=1 Tax=Massilia eurypsychrophila TaxID=1485217 RepID=A0A2G8TGU9_9BURK|nr:bifunctional metallophosphatase/5'-nucleotidase [Massilia eurypsychrophila]PIL45281.1 bifunctional metallophosphatase/5'-nucleotidase [Massilia eurypsychrophila]